MSLEQDFDLTVWEEGLKDIDTNLTVDSLQQVFEDKMTQLREADEDLYNRLEGWLENWAFWRGQSEQETLWDLLKTQIEFMANKKGISPEDYVDFVFKPTKGKNFVSTVLNKLLVSVIGD